MLQLKQEVNGLLQAVTFWVYSAHLSAKGGESLWSLAEKKTLKKWIFFIDYYLIWVKIKYCYLHFWT